MTQNQLSSRYGRTFADVLAEQRRFVESLIGRSEHSSHLSAFDVLESNVERARCAHRYRLVSMLLRYGARPTGSVVTTAVSPFSSHAAFPLDREFTADEIADALQASRTFMERIGPAALPF